MSKLASILQYPIQFKLDQTKHHKQKSQIQTQNQCFQQCDSFNQNHYSFKKNNNEKNIFKPINQNKQKSQNNSPCKFQNAKSNLYVSYKINQTKNVPEFSFKCKIQQDKSNRTSPNFKQSLIKIQQSNSSLKQQKELNHSQRHQLSYQNQQSINPFKKSSQFKNKKTEQIKDCSIHNVNSDIFQNLKNSHEQNTPLTGPKRLFFQNEDTFQQLLKRQNNSNYTNENNHQQSLVFDDLQNENVFTPYKINPIRNQYLANRSISSLQRQFQRDLDKFASFNSKQQIKNQSQSTSNQYKPFRPIAQISYTLPKQLQFFEQVDLNKNNLLASESSSKDKDNIFFLTNINSSKKSRKMHTQPIQQFHFNLSNIINLDNSTYLNQNCCSQIKQEYNESSSKVKIKSLIYEFVDKLDCLPDYEVSSQLIEDLQDAMNKIVLTEQTKGKKIEKFRMNTEQSTSSDFKIFRNSIMKDKTNKLNEEKSKQRKTYMKGTISSSAKSLQNNHDKQIDKIKNKENIKDTRIRGKNEVYLKECLDTNRTKKSITPRRLF